MTEMKAYRTAMGEMNLHLLLPYPFSPDPILCFFPLSSLVITHK